MGVEIQTWSHVLQSLHVTLAPHNLLYDDGDTFKDDAHNISLEPSALHARAKDLLVLSRSRTELGWGVGASPLATYCTDNAQGFGFI